MTERQLRESVIAVMQGWLGWSEANGKYKQIIDLYNTQNPLPRGYAVQYDDEWCATTVTAAGIAAGLQDIILGECSCSRMVELYKAAGRWQERDDYVPDIGDIIMYYWKDGADYATTDCTASPNHVGFVGARTGTVLTIYEGNKGAAVATRPMQINGRYIRGYCLPDYASKADKEDEIVTYDQWKAFMNQYRKELQDNDSGDWSKEAREWAVKAGIVSGGGEINGLPNYMWEDLSTREQLIVVLYRFAKSIGQA